MYRLTIWWPLFSTNMSCYPGSVKCKRRFPPIDDEDPPTMTAAGSSVTSFLIVGLITLPFFPIRTWSSFSLWFEPSLFRPGVFSFCPRCVFFSPCFVVFLSARVCPFPKSAPLSNLGFHFFLDRQKYSRMIRPKLRLCFRKTTPTN